MKEVNKPWGIFKQFILNKKCSVKIITINPNQKLSLQKHKKRGELWYFLTPGTIQLEKKIIKVKKNQLIKIEKNKAHRALAKSSKVEFLEISTGLFDENDEIRLEDKYGRT
jgi:mannose-1-phosphate guanylyltransferase/mannose-6-phosphate isomerase